METARNAPELLELVRTYYALVYRFAFRLTGSAADAEDLTQQTFLTAQIKLEQLRSAETAKAWLCAIVRNAYLKGRRTVNGAPTFSLEHVAEPADAGAAESEFDSEALQAILNELPEEFRTALILYYFDEFSYKEIAEQMEVPIGTVMSRLARGKSHLRRRLCQSQSAAVPAARAH
jgi:RNA polymerase sigma-70 factor (ECF subfamily)